MVDWDAMIMDPLLFWSEGCDKTNGPGGFTGPLVCGVDEAGRGPLAGPVVAAAVILGADFNIEGLRDSKRMTPREREIQKNRIIGSACLWGIGVIGPAIIDKVNILQATFLAMKQAISAIRMSPEMVLVDGNRIIPEIDNKQKAIVGGDAAEPAISAASILAKTYRDAIMVKFDESFPEYGFARHKGYPTPEHIASLYRYGPCSIHRRSFRPVSIIQTGSGDS